MVIQHRRTLESDFKRVSQDSGAGARGARSSYLAGCVGHGGRGKGERGRGRGEMASDGGRLCMGRLRLAGERDGRGLVERVPAKWGASARDGGSSEWTRLPRRRPTTDWQLPPCSTSAPSPTRVRLHHQAAYLADLRPFSRRPCPVVPLLHPRRLPHRGLLRVTRQLPYPGGSH